MINKLHLKLILISIILLDSLHAAPMSFQDIVIVEISAKDLGLKIKSESAYHKNPKHRTQFRQANIEFLREAIPRARFIFIDMWYPDLLENDTDTALSEVLRTGKNLTLSGIGNFEGKTELTHPLFKGSVAEVGHIFFYNDNPKLFQFPPILCSDPQFQLHQIEQCPENAKIRHVAIIAAEGYLDKRLKHEKKGTYDVPKSAFSRFLRISLAEFKADPDYINDKLVILINKPLPHMDVHKTIKNKKLTGSEIIAEMILIFANNLATE